MFGWKWKNFIGTLAAAAFAAAICFGIAAANICKLSAIDGARTYYLDSSSSQSLQKDELIFQDLFRVRGESVRFTRPDGVSAETLARQTAETLGGEILFTENACGTVSYYGYAPKLGESICLYGKQVNFHIAVGGAECAVGRPIIFGGF